MRCQSLKAAVGIQDLVGPM